MNEKSRFRRRFINYKTMIGLGISVLGLYLGFRKFDSREFFMSLKETDLLLFFLAMLLMIFSIYLRSIRWKYLVLPLKKVPLKDLFGSMMICYFGNNVFPLRAGELLRAYSLHKVTLLSTISIFGTVVVERILDMIVFMIILLVSAVIFPAMPVWVKWSGAAAGAGLIMIAVLYVLYQRRREPIKRYLNSKLHSSSHTKILQPVRHFLRGIRTLRNTPHLGLISVLSAIIWLLAIFEYWLIGSSLHVFFSIQNLLLIFFVTSAIISVPSAPGYVGTYHAGAIGILVYLGYELSQAQVIAVILHAVGFLSLTLIGFIYFIKYHIHVQDTSLKEVQIDNDY
ncbi:MAG: flippase-like domain-containing protein [Candidatus Marinimicrobia bacterium]|nr:flippase-like domain-containing protein [Candidatus Neomarinimicrobiota bacterium]